MFYHPAYVPIPFALSVFAVVHNIASLPAWDLLAGVERHKALQWFRAVLKANGCPEHDLYREEEWFAKQLSIPD